MISQEKRKNGKALVTKEMALSNLGENIFIGDSATTSHMTSNKLGVFKFGSNKQVSNDWKWIKHQLYP